MASIEITQGFIDDLLKVELASKRAEIFDRLELLENTPAIGSRIISASIERNFGSQVRKLIVDPFDIIYQYDQEENVVLVVGLLHQREVR